MTRLCTTAALTFEEFISEIHRLFVPIIYEAYPVKELEDVQVSDHVFVLAEPSHISVLLVVSLGLLRL